MKRSWLARHPVGFMALYSIFYLSVFHYLEANVPLRSILVHCRLDDLIPFCKYAVIPYFAWFVWIPFTLFYLLWKAPREDFWRLCLPLFSGMTIALACYAVLPTAHDPARYEGEPYVLAADIAGGDNAGVAGWTWYTGAAGWYLRIAAEDLLGLHLRGGVLYPEPHLPAGWPECTVRWRDGAGLLHTIRLRPDGVTVDNTPYDGGGIGKKRPKPYSQDR